MRSAARRHLALAACGLAVMVALVAPVAAQVWADTELETVYEQDLAAQHRQFLQGGHRLGMGRMPHRRVDEHIPGQTISVHPSQRTGLWGGILAIGEFYSVINAGERPFRLQIDTGSSTMAVPSSGCTSCGRRPDKPYKPSDDGKTVSCSDPICNTESCSSGCPFFVGYADGSFIKGILGRDSVAIGNISARASFGKIEKMSTHFAQAQTDGIFGAAYKSLNCNQLNCDSTVLDYMVDNLEIEDVFGMCLSTTAGIWDLGFSDHFYAPSTKYTPILQNTQNEYDYYTVGVDSASFGTVDLGDWQYQTIVDSGTTLLVFPQQVMVTLAEALGSTYSNLPGADEIAQGIESEGFGCAMLSSTEIQQWPSFIFNFPNLNGVGSFPVNLGPEYYFLPNEGAYCIAASSLGDQPIAILGDIFMQSVYTTFDRRNPTPKVGFAPIQNCTNPDAVPAATGPWCSSCSKKTNTLAIALGVTATVVVIVVIALFFWRRRSNRSNKNINSGSYDGQYQALNNQQAGASAPPASYYQQPVYQQPVYQQPGYGYPPQGAYAAPPQQGYQANA